MKNLSEDYPIVYKYDSHDQALYCLDNAIGLGYRSINVLQEKLRSCDALGDYEEGQKISEVIELMEI